MIERVAILGVGALGAVYANIFHEAGIQTRLAAKEERYRRLVRDGIYINEGHYQLPVLDAERSAHKFSADPVIVTSACFDSAPVVRSGMGSHPVLQGGLITTLNKHGHCVRDLTGCLYKPGNLAAQQWEMHRHDERN